MLSSCVIDPTMYVANDDHSKFVDVNTRMSPSITSAEMTYEDAGALNLGCHWSSDETMDESVDGDKLFFQSWLPEHLSGMSWQSWYDGRLPSPTFPGDHLGGLSRDLWSLSPSLLLDNYDSDEAYDSRTTVHEQSVWESYCSHVTSTSTDESCPASRCPSCESPSVDACSPMMIVSDGVALAGSTSVSRASSHCNSLDNNVDDDELPARAWKRRRRRRRRRWSRQSTSRTQHITSHLSFYHGAHILRSLLLHNSRYGCYRSPHQSAAKSGRRSVSLGSDSDVVGRVMSGCHRHDRGGTAVPHQPRRTVSTPLIASRLSSVVDDDANTATTRRRCHEDHCYFNWKQASAIDCSRSRTSQCENQRQVSVYRHWQWQNSFMRFSLPTLSWYLLY